MKLTVRIIAATIVPFLLMLATVAFLFNRSISLERASVERDDAFVAALVEERFDRLVQNLMNDAAIISASRETAHAIEARDLRFLYEWTVVFHSPETSKIVITDHEGIVLSRSDAEFSFSDSVAETVPFFHVLEEGSVLQGVYTIDGSVVLADARPILMYGEIPVGSIVTAVELNEALLERLIAESDVGIELRVRDLTYRVGPLDREERRRIPLEFETLASRGAAISGEVITFRADNVEELIGLQREVFLSVTAVLLFLLLLLAWLVRAYLHPYDILVIELLALAEGRTSFAEVGPRFDLIFTRSDHDATIIAGAVAQFVATIDRNMKLLEELSRTDQLTGLHNRRRMTEVLTAELDRAVRYDTSFAVMICDIDNFKRINDTYGHNFGDEALKKVAQVLRGETRSTDAAGRWGGEEFIVVCPQLTSSDAIATAEKLRSAVETLHIWPGSSAGARPHDGEHVGTISVGVTEYRSGDTEDSVVARADRALYEAKRLGRNRVSGALGSP